MSDRLTAYLIVGFVAFSVTAVVTVPARRLAIRMGLVVLPDPEDGRRVHTKPLPTSGVPLLIGFLVAMAVASELPALEALFIGSTEPLAVVAGAVIIFAVGFFDDLKELSPPAKMAGIVLSGSVMSLLGLVMVFLRIPFLEVVALSPDLQPLLTVLWVAGMCNAINLIDGLDGLAAGVVAIAAGAFFIYTMQLGPDRAGLIAESNVGPLVAVAVLGICAGFLIFNWRDNYIQMGDAGALLLGLLMASATLVVGGRTDQPFSGSTYFFFAPIFIPFFILGVPIVDTAFSILRKRGRFAVADKGHFHHRLMQLGHGRKRSVLILYAWTAILSAVALYPTITNRGNAFVPAGIAALGVVLYTLFHPGIRRGDDDMAPPAVPKETGTAGLR